MVYLLSEHDDFAVHGVDLLLDFRIHSVELAEIVLDRDDFLLVAMSQRAVFLYHKLDEIKLLLIDL